MLDACEIEPTEEVPSRIRERDEDEYEFELDSWARWDMPSDYTEYYDLEQVCPPLHSIPSSTGEPLSCTRVGFYGTRVQVPEQNTGYDGSRVWRFIHQKICFQLHLDDPGNRRDTPEIHPRYTRDAPQRCARALNITPRVASPPRVRWKRDFNRAVAGLHAAVSASIGRDLLASGPAG